MAIDLERYYSDSYPPSLYVEPEPITAPAPGGGIPTTADTKAVIVAWLLANGVELTEPALMQLTKAELLELVADLVDEEEEPEP